MSPSLHTPAASAPWRQRGLTLIELMVGILLVSILSLMSAQLGGQWVNGARVSRTQATLQQAYSAAKSAALQNNRAVTGQDVAASLCIQAQPNQITAVLGGDCTATPFWSAPLDSSVSIDLGNINTGTCIQLNNAAVPVPAAQCTLEPIYAISAGTVHVQDKQLH